MVSNQPLDAHVLSTPDSHALFNAKDVIGDHVPEATWSELIQINRIDLIPWGEFLENGTKQRVVKLWSHFEVLLQCRGGSSWGFVVLGFVVESWTV